MKDRNPIKALREKLGLDRNQLAILVGTSYQQIAAVEVGQQRTIPKTWKSRLEGAGFDYEAINAAYIEWRVTLLSGQRS